MKQMKVVHCKKESHDVYIGRPSKWGNPYSHKNGTSAKFKVNTREEAIEAYREWITKGDGKHLLNDLHELKGKILGCWCKPLSCHGDVLVELLKMKNKNLDWTPEAVEAVKEMKGFDWEKYDKLEKQLEKMKIFIICTVRGATEEYKKKLEDYTKSLENEGNIVHLPHRDTKQDARGIDICMQNATAIKEADEVHIFYNSSSQGTHFDMGVSFALGKKIIIAESEEVPIGKSFQRMLLEWGTISTSQWPQTFFQKLQPIPENDG